MNRDIKEKWIQALRSGEYQQTTSYLRENCNFCVLGVLCDLYDKEQEISNWHQLQNSSYYYYEGGHNDYELPEKVAEWAGITQPDLVVNTEEHNLVHLYMLNDGDDFIPIRNYSFEELASLIEEQL